MLLHLQEVSNLNFCSLLPCCPPAEARWCPQLQMIPSYKHEISVWMALLSYRSFDKNTKFSSLRKLINFDVATHKNFFFVRNRNFVRNVLDLFITTTSSATIGPLNSASVSTTNLFEKITPIEDVTTVSTFERFLYLIVEELVTYNNTNIGEEVINLSSF